MRKFIVSALLLVASCATTATQARRPDPRDQRREAQSATASHGDFEAHLLRDRPASDHAGSEAR